MTAYHVACLLAAGDGTPAQRGGCGHGAPRTAVLPGCQAGVSPQHPNACREGDAVPRHLGATTPNYKRWLHANREPTRPELARSLY